VTIQIVERAPGRLGGMAVPLPSNRARAQIAAMQRGRLGADVMAIDGNVWRRAVQHLEQRRGVLFVAADEQAEGHVSTPSCGRALEGNLAKIVRIAARTGAIILPLYSERLASATFITHVLPPVEFPQKLKLDKDLQRQQVAHLDALFSPVVLRLLDQWFGLLEYRL
jgi:KDO2-lipid IV(A) lauroyltransferase